VESKAIDIQAPQESWIVLKEEVFTQVPNTPLRYDKMRTTKDIIVAAASLNAS
jgi:hypothetical protein